MKRYLLLPLCALLSVNSCCENGAAPNDTYSNGNGSIAGRVILFDSTGTVLTDYFGVQVAIDGTQRTAMTDSSGGWQFNGLGVGIYDITASKPNFGTYHWYEQPVNNGQTDVATAALAQMPSYTPSLGSVQYVFLAGDSSMPAYYMNVSGSFPQLRGGISIAGYCDLDSTAQPGDPHLSISPYLVGTTVNNGNGLVFAAADLFAAGARPGQTLYFSAASVFAKQQFSTNYEATFVDPYHNSEVRYASNGPKSNVLPFTMR